MHNDPWSRLAIQPATLAVPGPIYFKQALTRIFHNWIEQRSGERVRRLEITQPNENATHRFFFDRL